MERPRLLGATILVGFVAMILGGLVVESIMEQRESAENEAIVWGWDDSDFAVGFHLGHSSLYVLNFLLPLLQVITDVMLPGQLSLGFEMEQA